MLKTNFENYYNNKGPFAKQYKATVKKIISKNNINDETCAVLYAFDPVPGYSGYSSTDCRLFNFDKNGNIYHLHDYLSAKNDFNNECKG